MSHLDKQNTVENPGRRKLMISGAAAFFSGLIGPQILGCRNSVAQNFEEPAANSPKKGAEAAKSGFEALSEEEVKALCSEDLIVRKFTERGNVRFSTLDGEKINKRDVKAQEVMGEDFWRYRNDDGDYLAHVPDSLEKGEALRFERVLKMNIKFDDDGGFKPVGIVDFADHRLRRKKHYKTEWIQKNGKNYFALIIKDQTFICPVAFEDLDKKDQEISLIHDYQIPSETPEKSAKIQEIEARFAEMKNIEIPDGIELTFDRKTYRLGPESAVRKLGEIVAGYLGVNYADLKIKHAIDVVKAKRKGRKLRGRDKGEASHEPLTFSYKGEHVGLFNNQEKELYIFRADDQNNDYLRASAYFENPGKPKNLIDYPDGAKYAGQVIFDTSPGGRDDKIVRRLPNGQRVEILRKNPKDESSPVFLAYFNSEGHLYKVSEAPKPEGEDVMIVEVNDPDNSIPDEELSYDSSYMILADLVNVEEKNFNKFLQSEREVLWYAKNLDK